MTSRQVRRAQEREAAKRKNQDRSDWVKAIHIPPPQDPPHRKGVSDRVIGQKRGHRSDWR